MRVAHSPPLHAFEASVAPSPDHVRTLEAALVAARAGAEPRAPNVHGLLRHADAAMYRAKGRSSPPTGGR